MSHREIVTSTLAAGEGPADNAALIGEYFAPDDRPSLIITAESVSQWSREGYRAAGWRRNEGGGITTWTSNDQGHSERERRLKPPRKFKGSKAAKRANRRRK